MKKTKEEIFEIIWTVVWLITLATFVVLRVIGVTAWSWWWVLSPIWGVFALLFAIIILGIVIIILYYIVGVIKIYWKHWRVKK